MSDDRTPEQVAHDLLEIGGVYEEETAARLIREQGSKLDSWEQVWTALNDMGAELGNANKPLAVAASWALMQQWVNDLHSGMYINCVYCGHRYGPNTEVPASMADVLKEHIEKCPKHPLSKALIQLDKINVILNEHRIASKPCALDPIECEEYMHRIRRVLND